MTQNQITERQQYWRDHVLAVAVYEGSVVEYTAANDIETKDLDQWKTAITERGFFNKACAQHCRLPWFWVGVF